MPDKNEIIERAKKSIIDADEDAAMELVEEVIQSDKSLINALNEGFALGNDYVGGRFDKGAITIVELLYSSEVMKNVIENILKLSGQAGEGNEPKGKVLIATVEGDVHDIGKGLVASTLQIAGFEVIDLGREVSVDMIIEAADKYNVDIIGTSALLTSTLTEQKKLEKTLREMGIRDKYKTMVGGAPCTKRWAKKIGADGYSTDAIDAVVTAKELLKKDDKE